MKNIPVKVHLRMFLILRILASGKRRVISTSKIRKMIAIKKNRSEKGSRADPLGSNPHSKGEFFSRSLMVFLEISEEIVITRADKIRANEIIAVTIKITLPVLNQSSWLEAKCT